MEIPRRGFHAERVQRSGKKGKPAQTYRFVADPALRVPSIASAVPSIQKKIAEAEAAKLALANAPVVQPVAAPATDPAAATPAPVAADTAVTPATPAVATEAPVIEAAAPVAEVAVATAAVETAPIVATEPTPAPAAAEPTPIVEAAPVIEAPVEAAPAIVEPVAEMAPVEPATAPEPEATTVEVLRVEPQPEATKTVLDETIATETPCPSCGHNLSAIADATGFTVWCSQGNEVCPIPDISLHGDTVKATAAALVDKWNRLLGKQDAIVNA